MYNPVPSDVNITTFISEHSINLALVIPQGFQDDVLNRTNVTVTLYGDPTQSSYGIAVSAVQGAITGYNFYLQQASPLVHLKPDTVSQRGDKYIDLFLPGIIGFTVLTTPLFGMTSICAEYRTRKYFKFLGTTKLSKAEWLAQTILF